MKEGKRVSPRHVTVFVDSNDDINKQLLTLKSPKMKILTTKKGFMLTFQQWLKIYL